jgi:hypothetical protein
MSTGGRGRGAAPSDQALQPVARSGFAIVPVRTAPRPDGARPVSGTGGTGDGQAESISGSVSGGDRRAAPGEMPTVRLNARLNAASDS